ncbi:MAG: hypothetical protein II393_01220 [Cytophagales bacterium]|nr:hypothetical protein [Cytophagales bacterium]
MNKDEIEQYLQGLAKNNKIPQTILIETPKKDGCAIAICLNFLQYISCERTDKPCGRCINCKQIEELTSPDMKIIFPSITGNNYETDYLKFIKVIKTDGVVTKLSWQEVLKSENKQLIINKESIQDDLIFMSLPPTNLKYRTTIIWLAEEMNASSANTLLKILEEPHMNRLFMIITNDSSRLLTTILSRAIKIKLNPTIRNNSDEHIELFMTWMRLCFTLNFDKLITFIDDVAKMSKDDIKMFLQACTICLEDIIKIKCGLKDDNKQPLERIASFIDNNKISKILKLLSEASYKTNRNVNTKIMMFNISIAINKIFKEDN